MSEGLTLGSSHVLHRLYVRRDHDQETVMIMESKSMLRIIAILIAFILSTFPCIIAAW